MAGWAERKRRALNRVHRTFERPAVYLTHAAGEPVRVNVRIHRKQIVAAHDEDGDFTAAASLLTLADRIIFDTREVPQVYGRAYVFYRPPGRPLEGYITGASKPEREGYIWVEVTPLSSEDLDELIAQVDTSHPAWEGTLP